MGEELVVGDEERIREAVKYEDPLEGENHEVEGSLRTSRGSVTLIVLHGDELAEQYFEVQGLLLVFKLAIDGTHDGDDEV